MPGSNELGTATLALETDNTKYEKGLKDAEASADRFGSNAAKSASKAGDGLDEAGTKAGGLGTKLGGLSTIAGGFVVGAGLTKLPGLLNSSISAASDLSEAQSKVNVVFKDSAGVIHDFTSNAAKSLGVSTSAAESAAGTFGNLFVAMGLGTKPAADLTQGILTLGSDLASFNNIRPEDALEKLRAGLVGEAEPLRALGVNMNAAMVEAKGMEMGLADANGELSESAKVQARYAIIMEQTKTAQGDFARTSGGLANQQRILKAQMEDVSAELGTALMPLFVALGGILTNVLIPALAVTLFPALQGIGTAVLFITNNFTMLLPILVAIGAALGVGLIVALTVLIPMVWAWAAAWAAAAIGIIAANLPLIALTAALMLLVAGIVLAVQHWDEIVAKFPILGTIVDTVKGALQAFVGFITGTFVPGVTGGITAIVDKVQAIWPTIVTIITPVMETVQALISGAWTAIQAIFSGAFDIITGLMDVFIGIFTGDWERVWAGVQAIISGAWSIISGIFTAQFDFLKGIWEAAFSFFNEITGGKLGEIVSTVTSSIGEVVGIISGFIGQLWEYAYSAGSALDAIGGFFWDMYNMIAGAISAALGWIDSLISKIRSIPSPSSILGSLNPFATGGRNLPEQWGIVGENGPELMYIPQGSDIYSTQESARMVKNGMNLQTIAPEQNSGSGVTVAFNGPTEIYARDKEDARRGAGDVGWATMQALKARGA